MKKILAIMAATILVLSMAGCGNGGDAGSAVIQGGAVADADGNEIKGSTIDGAGQEVDMDKIEGETLEVDETENKISKGEISNYYVSIDEAKVMTTEDQKILVIEFTYENKSSQPAAFSNLFSVDVTQDEIKMMPAVINKDGVNLLSGVEQIDPGKKTKVQKAYFITDEETPVSVMVYKYAESENGAIEKKFRLK